MFRLADMKAADIESSHGLISHEEGTSVISRGMPMEAGGSYLELEDILNTVEFLLETAIDTHCQQCILIQLPKAPIQGLGPAPESGEPRPSFSPHPEDSAEANGSQDKSYRAENSS